MDIDDNKATIVFEAVLRMLPPRQLLPNASRFVPVGMRIRLKSELKEAAALCILQARARWECQHGRWQPLKRASLKYTFVFKQARQRDMDNYLAGMKLVQDQLVQCEIIAADDAAALVLMPPDMVIGPSAPLVIIKVYRRE
jgi:hypothetical protein